ncbi:DUF6364 family protein [Persicitalea sp.]|uniref:DUF6364 family protein n=1 Tax=Persicitalea sp. TaxID=3100273 RepID=UPI003593D4CC
MDAKLTLKLDKGVIEKAKEYAAAQERSLSNLVESYLKALVNREKSDDFEEIEITPFVRSMATGNHLPADFDYKTAYRDHLIEKHK